MPSDRASSSRVSYSRVFFFSSPSPPFVAFSCASFTYKKHFSSLRKASCVCSFLHPANNNKNTRLFFKRSTSDLLLTASCSCLAISFFFGKPSASQLCFASSSRQEALPFHAFFSSRVGSLPPALVSKARREEE